MSRRALVDVAWSAVELTLIVGAELALYAVAFLATILLVIW